MASYGQLAVRAMAGLKHLSVERASNRKRFLNSVAAI
jgi:hypothetical protein